MARFLTNAFRVLHPRFCLFRLPRCALGASILFTMSSNIDEAVDYTLSNPTALIKQTARAFDVAPRTLSRRLNGGLTRQEGHSSQQILSPSQEKMLVSWILEQESQRSETDQHNGTRGRFRTVGTMVPIVYLTG
jgi:hypothetical protein